MKFFLLCLFVTLVVNGEVQVSSATAAKSGSSPRLVNLGTVEGKSFFADNTHRTWHDAKEYCSSLGMRLATIRSPAQWNLLDNANDATNFDGFYWTGGRDASTPSQFHWDNTNDEIGSGLDYVSQLLCINDGYGSLCET